MRHNLLVAILGLALLFGLGAAPVGSETNEAPYVNPAVNGPEDPAYWVDLGGLYATYGAYPAAIKAYEKALTLNPASLAAQYNLALAHAELGQLDQALGYVNKVIAMAPGEHRYYYARARILLVAGLTAEAMQDFRKAADLGNPDAIAFLEP